MFLFSVSANAETEWPDSVCHPAQAASQCEEGFQLITADLNFGINTYCVASSWWPVEEGFYPNRLGSIVKASGQDMFTPDIDVTVRKTMQIVCEHAKTYN